MRYAIPAENFGIQRGVAGSCWTIDQTSKAAGGADNGFLDCARAHTAGYSSHGSTAEATQHLVKCLGATKGIANIVGHGNDGLIVTGQGQSPSDPLKFVTTWNQNRWEPNFKTLNGAAGSIKLWACHPGTGQPGADLVYAMMLVTNATCMGPTGFLYCSGNGLYLEAGSTWQVASPGHAKPNPIPAPTSHIVLGDEPWEHNPHGGMRIRSADISLVRVTSGGGTLIDLRGDAARDFLRLIDFAHPFRIDGVLGALITAQLLVATVQDRSATFSVLNNRLLQSEDDPNLYYNCSSGFVQALTTGLR